MKSKRIHFLILTADYVWILFALLGSFYLRYHGNPGEAFSHPIHGGFVLLLGASLVAWFFLYTIMDLDCFRGGWQASAMISKTSVAIILQMSALVSWGYLARLYYSRLLLLYFGVLIWAGVTVIRVSALNFFQAQIREGKSRRVVVIGDNGLSQEIVYWIRRHPELLYEVVGFLSPFGGGETGYVSQSPGVSGALGSLDALDLLKDMGVHDLIVVPKHAPGLELQGFLVRCQEEGIHILVLPQPYELYVSRPKLIEIGGLPLIFLEQPSFSKVAQSTKRIFDLAVGLLLFVPAAIILAVIVGALWAKERRFLRKETRCGRNGWPFAMYRVDIETDEAVASKYHKLLRRLSISELPQLLNVLQGQMSLVGPRPESPEQVRDYSEWQKQRLKVKPGMTGLAQVNGLREHHPSTEKIRHDLEYILHWTLVFDVVLLFQTIWTLAGRLVSHQKEAGPSSSEESLRDNRELSRPVVQPIRE